MSIRVMKLPDKLCERCTAPALAGMRFCKGCKRIVLAEMRERRYLAPKVTGHAGDNRTFGQRENTHETKFGPWQR